MRSNPLFVAGLALLVAGPAVAAPAAQGAKPAPAAVKPAAAQTPAAPSEIAERAASPELSLRTLAERAKALESDVRALSEERRVLRQSMQAGRRELSRQLDGARRAKKRYDTAAAKAGGKPQPADLDTARAGFSAALESGKLLEQQTKQLTGIEQKLEQLATQARGLETSLKAASSELKGIDRELTPALSRVAAQLKSARSTALQARTESGFAWQSYATAKARTDKAIAGTDTALAMLTKKQQELAAAEKASAVPAPRLVAMPAPTSACKTLTDSQLRPGSYARKDHPDQVLTLAPGCDAPSVLRNTKSPAASAPAISSVLQREKLDNGTQATLHVEEGDLCFRYALQPSKTGGIALRWAPDPTASANRMIADGCKGIEGEYLPVATDAAAVPAAKCDIKQVEWDKLKSLPGHGELTRSEDYTDTQEQVDQVLYGDLDADGTSEAYVAVSSRYGANNGSLTLYAYTMTAQCSLQVLGNISLPGGCAGVDKISVAGKRLKIDGIPEVDEGDMESRCLPKSFTNDEYALEKGKLKFVKSTKAK